jgi:hypothetical protein
MQSAPRRGEWVTGQLYDGSVVRMHYAQDMSGEVQPPFEGWFERVDVSGGPGYFRQVRPASWKPITPETADVHP